MRYVYQGENVGLNRTSLIAVVPYYPDFTYNVRGGYFPTILSNSLTALYLFNDEIFEKYHNNISNTGNSDLENEIPRIRNANAVVQYDTSANAGADREYAWFYHKTPPETELVGPKYLAICAMDSINEPAKNDLGQEYYNQKIQELNDSGPKLTYVTKFADKNAPRRLLSTYVKSVDRQNDGTYYASLLAQSDCPLAGAKWTLFGDSLTDAYGGMI